MFRRHHDLAHVRAEFCLADCPTKAGCKPDALTEAVRTSVLPYCDAQPLFRQSMQHKAYVAPAMRDHGSWKQSRLDVCTVVREGPCSYLREAIALFH